jgi:hypothetical protein
MVERMPDSLEPEWIYMGEDSLENARKAKEGIEKNFPEVNFKIVSDPVDISSITPKPIHSGNVLIQVIIPREKRVNTVDLWKTWTDSLRK